MQLFAKNKDGSFIFAEEASKGYDYFCTECEGVVRKKSGLHKQTHFFHLKTSPNCKLSNKSITHLEIQYYLQNRLNLTKECLEVRFDPIQRIADVVWEEKKLIFEVQCSDISATEVKARNADYASLGYQVIWLLHDKKYNQYKMSRAEIFLQTHPHYYTNINSDGRGIIYDQFSVRGEGGNWKKLPPQAIDIGLPSHLPFTGLISSILRNRKSHWRIHFSGDLLDPKWENSSYLEKAKQLEKQFLVSRGLLGIFHWIYRKYLRLFHLFLKRVVSHGCN